MKIISWNVNGIRAVHRKGLLLPFLEKENPDIFCIQETKAKQEECAVDMSGYNEYWNSAQKKGYSGTAIFSKEKPLSVSYNIPENIAQKYDFESDPHGNPNTEGRVVALELENFYVVSVYTPNAKDDLSRIPLRHTKWDKAFLDYMKQLEEKKPVVFCGDLNVAHTEDDLANPQSNKGKKGFTYEEREGVDNFIKNGFVDTFRIFTQGNGHYSWWSHFANSRARNVGWRIDYIFVSQSLVKKVTGAHILADVLGSDHCPVVVEIE